MVCLLAGSIGCGGGGCNGGDGPVFDTCDNPAPNAVISSLALVRPAGSGYAPINDYDVIPFTYGGQGSPMIDVYLSMTGDVPRCLAQRSEVRSFVDAVLEYDEFPRSTYAQADGTFVTKGIFLIMSEEYYGLFVRLIVSAGGQTVERHVYLQTDDYPDAFGGFPDARVDAATDAGTPDAIAEDAQVSDAAVTDANWVDAMP